MLSCKEGNKSRRSLVAVVFFFTFGLAFNVRIN